MNLVLKRIWALFLKETLTLLKDRRGRIVLIGPPILQLVIFSFAATLEVKNISLAVYNEDTSKQAQEFINQIIGSKTFKSIFFVKNKKEVQSMIEQQIVIGAIHIPDNFSNHIKQNRSARIQVILDGRRSNAAQIVAGYLRLVTERYTQALLKEVSNEGLPPVIIVSRHWFNENLLYTWFTVPSLVAILSMLVALIVTSLSVARERELGTFDQLLVSPLMPYEILMGKTLPAVSISLCEGLLIWTIGVLLFKIPFTGHFLVLVFFLIIFIFSIVGAGLFISAISKTQQQAILGAFIFMVPAITLSGYAAPVENMPTWLQALTWFNPLMHGLIVTKGLFLKELTFVQVWVHTWPLLVIAFLSLWISGFIFSRRLE